MDFKKKWQHFWTLNRHHDGGFTLVELIIVIAIMAILAGVAVPSYSLYVKKAEESADQQLLKAVNTAFASACLEGKVDAKNVTEAEISVIDQQVYGLSKVASTVTETSGDANANYGTIASAFLKYYVESNQNAVFKTENVNSLVWENGVFQLSNGFVATAVTLSDGTTVTISAEDMEAIQNSTYADMGYSGVAQAIKNVGKSATNMASLMKVIEKIPFVGGKLGGKLTAVLVANGLIDEEGAKALAPEETGNGLQMVTAKYLSKADEDDINELLQVNLNGSTMGMIEPLAAGTGGTKTVAAAALQYALIESFANSPDMKDKEITMSVPTKVTLGKPGSYKEVTMTVEEYLASDYAALDPIAALTVVQGIPEYDAYTQTEQYQKDINGFVGTMSLLGDNIGTTSKPGAVDIDQYFEKGVESSDAKDILTEILGE